MHWFWASTDAQLVARERVPGSADVSPSGVTARWLGMIAVSGAAVASTFDHQWHDERWRFWIGVVLGVVSFALVPLRRRYPVLIAVLLTITSTFSALGAGPWTLALVSLATRRIWWQIFGVGVFGVLMSMGYYRYHRLSTPDTVVSDAITAVVFTTTALAWGAYLGSRRDLMWSLRQRADEAEEEQLMRIEHARAEERTHIAREMHDVLAHRISRIAMHSGALAFRDDLPAEPLREGLREIQDQSHQALAELREVLGVLRANTDAPPPSSAPLPGHREIPALLEDLRARGMRINSSIEVAGDVPEQTGRALYRIVQEATTNSHKHAPGTLLTVRIAGNPRHGIDFRFRNPLGVERGQTPGSGLGLVGVDERTRLAGGRITHETTADDFVLTGWLPWQT